MTTNDSHAHTHAQRVEEFTSQLLQAFFYDDRDDASNDCEHNRASAWPGPVEAA